MSIRGLKKWALLLTFWVALQGKLLRATTITGDTVTGNFTATGNADVQGNTFSFGTRTDNSNPGWLTFYTDGTTSSLEFDASRSANIWKWQQNGGATLKLQMTLDNNNALTLFDQASTPVAKITLNPLGTSTFANSVTLNGTNNTMPNQTLTGSGSVITEGLGDSRYASSSSVSPLISDITIGSGPVYSGTASNMGINGGTTTGGSSFAEGLGSMASGEYSTAMGSYSTASGDYSTAMGGEARASGYFSTALGWANASGRFSFAKGYYSTASGDYSTAMGGGAMASGNFSTALGSANASGYLSTAMGGATASGDYSFAQGRYTTASGFVSTAMGFYSTASECFSFAEGAWVGASGFVSTAMGSYTTASGTYSTAMGNHSSASGIVSTAFGTSTTASAYDSFVMGACNVGLNANGGTASATYWVPTDPLFEVGNGGDGWRGNPATGPSDALVVYKNGDAAVQGTVTTGGGITAGGVITAQPGGDIPMFTGN